MLSLLAPPANLITVLASDVSTLLPPWHSLKFEKQPLWETDKAFSDCIPNQLPWDTDLWKHLFHFFPYTFFLFLSPGNQKLARQLNIFPVRVKYATQRAGCYICDPGPHGSMELGARRIPRALHLKQNHWNKHWAIFYNIQSTDFALRMSWGHCIVVPRHWRGMVNKWADRLNYQPRPSCE